MSDPKPWPLWEVFTQPPGGGPHEHAGSLHAPDAELALQNARDTYSRRGEAVSIWVVQSTQITASSPATTSRTGIRSSTRCLGGSNDRGGAAVGRSRRMTAPLFEYLLRLGDD